MSYLSFNTAICMMLTGLLLSPPADATKKRKRKTSLKKLKLENIDPTLRDLRLGGDINSVMQWVQGQFQHHYDPTIARAMGVEKERWKSKVLEETAAAKKAMVTYKGGKHGYETSLIAKDFGRVPNESLIVAKVGKTRHYLMMFEGKLWRYVVSVRRANNFDAHVASVITRLGKPTKREVTPRPSTTWSFKNVSVQLRDQRLMYNGDTLVVTDPATATKLDKLSKKYARSTDGDATGGLGDVIAEPETGVPDTSEADRELEEYQRKYGKKKKRKKKK